MDSGVIKIIAVVWYNLMLTFFIQAIGTRNKLKSIAKHREAEKQQLHSLIAEKKMELER